MEGPGSIPGRVVNCFYFYFFVYFLFLLRGGRGLVRFWHSLGQREHVVIKIQGNFFVTGKEKGGFSIAYMSYW